MAGVCVVACGCASDKSGTQQAVSPPISSQTVVVAPAPVAPAAVVPPPAPSAEALDANAPLAVQTLPATVAPLSSPVQEVARLAQSGVEESVMLAYAANLAVASEPTAEELVYLHDLGTPASVTTVLIQRGRDARAASPAAAVAQAPVVVPAPVPAVAEAPAAALAAAAAQPQVVYTTPPATSVASEFYTTLSPYGTWMDIPGYGWSWRPTVAIAAPEWRPYCDAGRWYYTDAGWYWQSDYSWGWAPFHYGRWWRHAHYGWLWWPDRVWGPSWVFWRTHPSYCGWAPLPPMSYYSPHGFTYLGVSYGWGFDFGIAAFSFTFVDHGHLWDHHPRRYCLSGPRVHDVYRGSRVVNDFAEGPRRDIVHNRGIDPNRLPGPARSEIRKAALRDMPASPGRSVKPDVPERQGGSTVIHRARLPEASGSRPASMAGGGAPSRGAPSASRTQDARPIPTMPAVPSTRSAGTTRTEASRSTPAASTRRPVETRSSTPPVSSAAPAPAATAPARSSSTPPPASSRSEVSKTPAIQSPPVRTVQPPRTTPSAPSTRSTPPSTTPRRTLAPTTTPTQPSAAPSASYRMDSSKPAVEYRSTPSVTAPRAASPAPAVRSSPPAALPSISVPARTPVSAPSTSYSTPRIEPRAIAPSLPATVAPVSRPAVTAPRPSVAPAPVRIQPVAPAAAPRAVQSAPARVSAPSANVSVRPAMVSRPAPAPAGQPSNGSDPKRND